MGTLITILGTGKGSWHEVHGLLATKAFENVLVFIDAWEAQSYRNEYGVTLSPMPEENSSEQLVALMRERIKSHMSATQNAAEFDVAINLASGTGKQHAALIAAVITLGYGVRLVTFENEELKVILRIKPMACNVQKTLKNSTSSQGKLIRTCHLSTTLMNYWKFVIRYNASE